jgi:hypothetical protein
VKILCSWCAKGLGDVAMTDGEPVITHGICPSCLKQQLADLAAIADTRPVAAGAAVYVEDTRP